MKEIIFMGTPDFAATILEGIISCVDFKVIAVVTQPDRPVGRKRVITPPAVKKIALKHSIPVYQPEVLTGSAEYDDLVTIEADLIVTAAYGQFVPVELLEKPRCGAINVHASLLPKYRGGAPIHYAIWKGETETGVTIMEMVEKMDAGDILAQMNIPINDHDDVGSMFEKLALIGKELLLDTLPRIFDQDVNPQTQNADRVTYSPTIKKEEEQLNWENNAAEIDRHIRAFRPFPTTYTRLNGERVKIWEGSPFMNLEDLNIQVKKGQAAGTIIAADEKCFYVAAGQDSVFAVAEYQPSGKKRMSVAEFLKGTPADSLVGLRFESLENNQKTN